VNPIKNSKQQYLCIETSQRLAETNNIVANLKKELNGMIRTKPNI
jgi:hypothetical protein